MRDGQNHHRGLDEAEPGSVYKTCSGPVGYKERELGSCVMITDLLEPTLDMLLHWYEDNPSNIQNQHQIPKRPSTIAT